jgi:MATE family multidrug resistance protein
MAEEVSLPADDPSSEETSLRYMLRLAWPMVVTNISFTIMQFVDTRMVAELGTAELAAILPATIMSFIPSSFALGVMSSVNTFVSQCLGRGQKSECPNYCWQVTYMGLVYAFIVLVVVWPLAPAIFRVMGQPSEIIEMEVIYLRIMLYCQFLVVFIWGCNQFFMGIHRPIITMYSSLVGQVVNVVANYLLIYGKLGFPRMGIGGAAWGTFIGLLAGGAIQMFVYLGRDINKTYQSRRGGRIDFGKMLDVVKVGFPAGFGLMVNIAFWTVILFGLVGRFGKAPLAATSAVWSCMRISFMPVVGMGTALTAVVGKSIGKGRKDLAVEQTNVCLRIGLVYMGFVGLCFFVFREQIMRFWSPSDEAVIQAGVSILVCAAIFQMFDAILIVYSDALQGAGDTLWVAIIQASGAVLILGVGGICIVKTLPELGALGPWIAGTIKIVVVAFANRWRFKSNRWMEIDLFKRQAVSVPAEVEVVMD